MSPLLQAAFGSMLKPFVLLCVSVADGLELPTVSKCTKKIN